MDQPRDEPLALGSGHELLFSPTLEPAEGTASQPADAESGRHCQLLLVREAGLPAAPPPSIGYPSADAPFRVVAEAGWDEGGDAVALLLAPLANTPPGELEVGWPDGAVTVALPSPWRRRLAGTEPDPA
jgi:hypothetical protein